MTRVYASPWRFLLPNLLTVVRLALAVPIVLAALSENWVTGFWLIVVALSSDFADGLAAKMLNAYSSFGAHLDSLSDFVLAAAAITGLVFSHRLPLWIGLVLLVPAVAIGYAKFVSRIPVVRRVQPVISVPYLFATWIFATLSYATYAFGWSWWYIVVTLVLLAGAAQLKRHRLRAWFGWLALRVPHGRH